MTDEPLIWTSKGNLPQSSLTYKTGWDVDEHAIVFWEEYRLGDEIVKRAAHVLSKHGVTGEAVAAQIGA